MLITVPFIVTSGLLLPSENYMIIDLYEVRGVSDTWFSEKPELPIMIDMFCTCILYAQLYNIISYLISR